MDDALRRIKEGGGDAGVAATDLNACPACAGGAKAELYDGCFKLKQRKDTGQPHGPPLATSLIGSPSYDAETNEIVDLEMQRMRNFRHDTLKIPRARPADEPSDCPPMASTSSSKTSSRKHLTTGLHAGVCRHNVLCSRTACRIDTVSCYVTVFLIQEVAF